MCIKPSALNFENAKVKDVVSCQKDIDPWGASDQVTFDPRKECTAVVHHRFREGDDFKLLGVLVDVKPFIKKHSQRCLPCSTQGNIIPLAV